MNEPTGHATPPEQGPQGALTRGAELREVARSPHRRRIRDQGLVLMAMGIGHEAVNLGAETALVVALDDAPRALEELEAYDRENRAWPAPEELPEVLTEAALGVILWCLTLFVFFFVERNRLLGLDWWNDGKLIAAEIERGAWWRALTSLSLHDDLVHLASNMVFGALFIGIVCQVMGTGLALSATVLTGFVGNLLNAFLQGGRFSAIGASSAVFGALGILGAYRVFHRPKTQSPAARRRAMVPMLACIFLLGAYGTGGDDPNSRVDVLGHATGFVSGLVAGTVYAKVGSARAPGQRGQLLLGLGTLAALAAAGWLALTA